MVSQGEGEFRDGFWIYQDSVAGTVARNRFSDRGVLVLGGTNDSRADEPNLKVELLKCSHSFGRGTLFSFCSKTIFTASVNPSNRSVLDSCLRFPLILSSSQSSHMSTRCCCFFLNHRTFLIYVKLGLVGPQGTLLVFFSFIPKTKRRPRARAAVRGEQPAAVSRLFQPRFCVSVASKHKSELKSSFVSQSEATAFSVRPL